MEDCQLRKEDHIEEFILQKKLNLRKPFILTRLEVLY